MIRSAVFVGVVAVALATPASAHDIDRQEHSFGATHVSAQSGNGGLSIGVAPRGEITVLSWPSTSFFDQLDYKTSTDEDAREQPFFGADEAQGIFGGLVLETSDSGPTLLWLRDPAFTVSQRYLTESSGAIVMEYRHDELGLAVTETTFVDLSSDVVYRRATIKRSAESAVQSLQYVLYENLAPTADKPEDLSQLPGFTEHDDDKDFLALWDPRAQAVVHFAPPDAARDNTLLDGLMTGVWGFGDSWDAIGIPSVDELWAGPLSEGSFIAIGGAEPPAGFQVGWQSDMPCDRPEVWSWAPTDAFADLADGQLDGSPVASCHANAAMTWDAELPGTGTLYERSFDTFWSVAGAASPAVAALETARGHGFDAALTDSDATWALRADGWRLPDDLDPEVIDFSRRALIAVVQGTDRDSGAMVAALSTQPSYHHDWPRDSVFFNLALDLAGEFEAVGEHNDFLVSVQNRDPLWAGTEDVPLMISPPGAWLMNYYADGKPSTQSINNFEIDQVGLSLWSFWAHSTFAPNDNLRRDAIASAWPAIERGAQLLAACVDDTHPALGTLEPAPAGIFDWYPLYEQLVDGTVPDPALRQAAMEAGDWEALQPCRANEDDHPLPSVSIYSTQTTRMGLLAAVRAAEALCLDDDPKVDYWRERAGELGAVAWKLFYDADAAAFEGGQPDWLLWPDPLEIDPAFDVWFSDAATEGARRVEVEALVNRGLSDHAERIQAEVDDAVNLRTEGAAYENKKTLSLARWWTGDRLPDGGEVEANVEHVRQMAVDLPIEGTRHVGEVWVSIDDDGDGVADRADQRVSTPHLWAATLTYLSAMALARPDLFEALESDDVVRVCNSGEEPLLSVDVADCEACSESLVGPGAGRRAGFGAIAVLLAVGVGRRRRR